MKIYQLLFLLLTSLLISTGVSFASDEFDVPIDSNLDFDVQHNGSDYTDPTFMQPPMEINGLDDDAIVKGATPIPIKYDLRELGRVTPVKDQSPAGVCWTFASLASLESNLLPSETWDFSENNMKNLLSNTYPWGYDRNFDSGGNSIMALSYLARYSGPVTESSDPFNPLSNVSPSGLEVVKHVQNMYIIPSRDGPLDNELLKRALMEYGAIDCDLYWDPNYYNSIHKSYYSNNNQVSANHDICLVGWDDNYSRYNFKITPPGNGAFIIKNSWGTGWGDGGYFYLSYYDFVFGYSTFNSVFVRAEEKTNYNEIYQYDPLGWVGQIGLSQVKINSPTPSTAWFANRFTSLSSRALAAISFYAPATNAAYELFAVVGDNEYVLNKGTLVNPGYYTIKLNQKIPLLQGQQFFVVVKLTTPNYFKPICIEYPKTGWSSKARANKGDSFVSMDGVNWNDLTDEIPNANVCLKAFTVNSANLKMSQVSSDNQPEEGQTLSLTVNVANNGPDTANNVQITNQIPSGLKLISYSSSQGGYNPETGLWDLGEVQSGENEYITFLFMVEDPGDFMHLVNLASGTFDPEDANGTSSLLITVMDDEGASGEYETVGATVAMQPTGMPILPLIMAMVLVMVATIYHKKE